MRIETVSTSRSSMINDYVSGKEALQPFYRFTPDHNGLEKALRTRQFTVEKRRVLKKTLEQQYAPLEMSEKTAQHIQLLEHTNTFTVTTGHQLSLFTGPLFFIYKIVSTLKLCEELTAKYPLYNFVPVYWMASEDHDFEEINHFHLFNQKYEWNTDQKGAVGAFDISGVREIFETLNDDIPAFRDAYKEGNLSDATLKLVNTLFGKHGLVILEPNHPDLKRLFSDQIKDELLHQSSSESIHTTSNALDELGYKIQVNPREINLFYLDHQLRERIVWDGDTYRVNNTDISFTNDEMMQLVDEHPEKFSPNVTLRPVYQEVILPNLAYIGGPGELAYWLQLKDNFERLKVFYPALILRDSFLMLNNGAQKQMAKLELTAADLLKDFHTLKKELVERLSGEPFSAENEMQQIEQLLDNMKARIGDQSLHPAVDAETQKIHKSLENLEKRIQKSEERQHDQAIKQLENLKNKLFPDGAPQERVENVLNFSINDVDFIDNVYQHANPLNTDLKIAFL